MKKYILILSLLFFPICNAEIIITEIMYNPNGPDTYLEYVEIYNSGNSTVNLENYTLCNSALYPGYINKTVYLNNSLNLTPNSFAIITDGGSGTEVYDMFNVSTSSLALHVFSSSICGGLSNSGDTLFFNFKNITYSSDWGANGDGKSLHLLNETWIASKPSPGYAFVIENFNDTSEKTSEQINYINISEIECDTGIIIYSPRLMETKNKYEYYLYLYSNKDNQYAIVEYWIEDLFGKTIRKQKKTNILSNENKSRSFTPSEIFNSEVYLIKAKIIEQSCDSDLKNNEAEFLIGIKGVEESEKNEEKEIEEKQKEISVEIIDFPEEARQGDNITIIIRLNNPTEKDEEMSVYSYVYFNQKIATENGWTPNVKKININEDEELTIELKNKIKENAEPTFWNLKVKVKSDSVNIEAKEDIKIIEKHKEMIYDTQTEKDEEKNTVEKIVYISEKKNYLEISKYLIIPIVIFISFIVLLEIKKDNFLKEIISPTSNGQRRNKTKVKRRSNKS